MKSISKFTILLFLIYFPLSSHGKERLILGVGQSISLPKGLSAKAYVSNGNAVRAKSMSQDQILIIGKALGSSEVHIGKKSWVIEVTSKHAFLIYQKLESVLKNIPSIKATLNMHCPSVEGKLLRWEDWVKIQRTMTFEKRPSHCKQVYQFNASIDPVLQTTTPPFLRDITSRALIEIQYDKNNFIQIHKTSFSKSDEIEQLLDTHGLLLMPSTPGSETYQFQLELLAVSESEVKNAGLLLPREAEINLNSQNLQEELIAKLSSLADNGKLENLLETNLQLSKKQKAKFHSGGEIPISLISENSSQVTWKSYGFLLNLEILDSIGDQVLLSLELELSNIDSSVSIQNIPSIQKHEYKNKIHLRDNQKTNIFHFKLLSDQSSKSSFHFLRNLSLFKKLFSQEYERKQNYHIFINLQRKE
jgi:hypothetical protein